MDINQLRTFVTVAREGSITRSSEILHRSQPAVSAHIKTIEERLQIRLFDRTPRGMETTPNGKRLAKFAADLLEDYQLFLDEAQRIRGSVCGELRIGAPHCIGADTVAGLIVDLYARYPQLDITLDYGSAETVRNGLHNGYYDIGFFVEGTDTDARIETVETGQVSVYLTAAPSLIADGNADLGAMAQLPCICPSSCSCYAGMVEELFTQAGFRPERLVGIDDAVTARRLICEGVGTGVIHGTDPGGADIVVLSELRRSARVVCGYLAERADDLMIRASRAMLQGDHAPAERHPLRERRACANGYIGAAE